MTNKITNELLDNLQTLKLATVRRSVAYPELRVVKYSRRVFYDNLWNDVPILRELRGLVVDDDCNIVSRPFTKIFNYMENGTTLDRDTPCVAFRKVNGFMAAVSIYKGKPLVSTTGSLDSPFAELANKWVNTLNNLQLYEGFTLLFEVCDPSDPHIIKEDAGIYFLAARLNSDSSGSNFAPDTTVEGWEQIAEVIGARFPEWKTGRFGDLVKEGLTAKYEGLVVYPRSYGSYLTYIDDTHPGIKIKSNYYKTTKFLARMKEEKLDRLLDDPQKIKQTIDEEFFGLVDYLYDIRDEFVAASEQSRISYVENYFNEKVI